MAEAQKFCREYYEELATIFNAEDQIAALRAVSAQSLTDAVRVHSQYNAFCPRVGYWNPPYAKCVVHGQSAKVWGLRDCTNPCQFVCQKSKLILHPFSPLFDICKLLLQSNVNTLLEGG